jgi:serine acetyltransferase
MIATIVTVHTLVTIGIGAICNTFAIIEQECKISNFAHIGPGAVVCGNVSVGECSFIGAKSVIKENISIGKKVTVGAGSVVIRDIPDNVKVVGNPDRIIK